MKIGVFSVSLPEYDIVSAATLLADLGYDAVEWRVAEVGEVDPKFQNAHDPQDPAYGNRYWVNNKATLDVNNIEAEAKRAKAISDEHGIEIFALTSYVSAHEPDRLEPIFKAAAANDIPAVRLGITSWDAQTAEETYPEALAAYREALEGVQKMGQTYGVKGLIELHHASLFASPSAAYRMLEYFDPAYLGVIFDPGNMVFEGYEEYLKSLQLLGDYVAHVHIKNAGLVPGEPDDQGIVSWERRQFPIWEGSADLAQLYHDLKAVGYQGNCSVEDFSNEATTEEKLRANIKYIRQWIADAGLEARPEVAGRKLGPKWPAGS